jgi:hypothetical protein
MVVIQSWRMFILCTEGLAMVHPSAECGDSVVEGVHTVHGRPGDGDHLQRMVLIQSWRVFILCTAGLAMVIISRGW